MSNVLSNFETAEVRKTILDLFQFHLSFRAWLCGVMKIYRPTAVSKILI